MILFHFESEPSIVIHMIKLYTLAAELQKPVLGVDSCFIGCEKNVKKKDMHSKSLYTLD